MKVKLLKKLRKKVSEEYRVKKIDDEWRIYTSPEIFLSGIYTKDAVIYKMRELWHKKATEYLWNNRDKKFKEFYVW